jgi:membrane dipeptidase
MVARSGFTISEEARSVHDACPSVDLHADSLLWARWVGYDITRKHEPPLPRAALFGHVDVPRLREGNVGAQFFGLVSMPVGSKGAFAAVSGQIDELEKAIALARGELVLARSAHDVTQLTDVNTVHDAAKPVAALLGLEGAHALEGSVDNLVTLAKRGLRYLGLLHFSANDCGAPALGWGQDETLGLTRFGHTVIEAAEANGVIVDLAHINRLGFLDACVACQKPPIVSHTGVLGAFEHWRNIDDVQLRAVADRGGCIGVIYCPQFVGPGGVDAVVAHLKHIVNVVGEDAPALGSDWDGFIVPTPELADPRGMPRLTEALLRAGFTSKVIHKILRGNAVRVLADHPCPDLLSRV